MDYLITGGNGFIGRNLTAALIKSNKSYEVVDTRDIDQVDSINLDVVYSFPTSKFSTVVHLASETDVRQSIKTPRDCVGRNVYGILNVLESSRKVSKSKVIFTSSASSEKCLSPYLASKAACESICESYKCSYGLDIKVLKLSNVYGPHSLHKESVIPKFIRAALNHEDLTIYGDGNQRRDFIHVDDVVSAILNGYEGFIATGSLTSIRSIAFMISDISEALTHFKPKINYIDSISGEVRIPHARTDIKNKVCIDEGLIQTFGWFKENYKNGH